jgi:hypothetical protein
MICGRGPSCSPPLGDVGAEEEVRPRSFKVKQIWTRFHDELYLGLVLLGGGLALGVDAVLASF